MSEMTDVQAKTFFTEEDSLFPALVHGDQIPIVEFLEASAHLGNFFSMNNFLLVALLFFCYTVISI